MTSYDTEMTTHEPTMNHIGNPMNHMKHNETAQDTASNLMNRPMNHIETHESHRKPDDEHDTP